MPSSKDRTAARLALVALLMAALVVPAAAPATASQRAAARRAGDVIPGSYVVVLAEGAVLERVTRRHVIAPQAVTARYDSALLGFAATMSEATAQRLAADPAVEVVEPDRWLGLAGTQSSPPWGLDRTDQRDLPLSGTYAYGTTGADVDMYIIDTGVRSTHSDFGGRVAPGATAVHDGRGTQDCNGHGTHVAATAAGTSYGIAKGATIVPVRVMGCDAFAEISTVAAGVDWVTKHHTRGDPAVANMSIAAKGSSAALDKAINASILDGVTYVVAAGNADEDACGYTPASVAAALTVGASHSNDARASFSNYGPCLDLFAPGTSIKSAWHTGDTAAATMSGTSMAAPHVAGAAARYLQSDPGASPADVTLAITSSATPLKVSDAGVGSPKTLLHVTPPSVDAAWTASPPPASNLTMSTSTSALTYGNSLTVRGRLTSDGNAVAYEPVRVERRRLGTTTWRLLTTRKTNTYGRISYTGEPPASADYRLRYVGDVYQDSTSAKSGVGVRTRVRGGLNDSTVQRGAKATLSGSVRPSHAGKSVVLQRYRDGKWRFVRSKSLSAKSRYTFRLGTSRRGTYRYRAVKPADTDHLRGFSPGRTLTVE